jgi:hypothetical protein
LKNEVSTKPSSKTKRNRKEKANQIARVMQVTAEGRLPSAPNVLELTDANIEKIRFLRDTAARLNPTRSDAFACLTFPLAAPQPIQALAAKRGIPVTQTGICFLVQDEDDLNLACAQFRDFVSDVMQLGNSNSAGGSRSGA